MMFCDGQIFGLIVWTGSSLSKTFIHFSFCEISLRAIWRLVAIQEVKLHTLVMWSTKISSFDGFWQFDSFAVKINTNLHEKFIHHKGPNNEKFLVI